MSTILIIDQDPQLSELLNVSLKDLGYFLKFAQDGKEGIKLLENQTPDIILCNLNLPDYTGIEILEKVKVIDIHIQFIMMTDNFDMSYIIKAMQKGSFDYLFKPLDFDQLKLKISRALEIQHMSQHLETYTNPDSEEYKLENSLVGRTPVMRELVKNIGQLSSNRVSVLILGESGTGKELIARIIHYTGISKDQPFVAVNCSSLSENLLESELFGHVKGAFTNAFRDKKGKFELAGSGTIFLDEISELSFQLQAKLLRVLQEREFEKVGGEHSIPMNARILAASNKNLEKLINEDRFREDLYYRLKVFTIDIPPLRKRVADIPLMVTHFLRKINNELHKSVKKVPFEVMEYLQEHSWPGNVRELENVLYQAVVLSKNEVLLKENIIIKDVFTQNEINNTLLSLEEVEKNHICHVLNSVDGDKTKAIKILGISKPTLYSKLRKYNLYNSK
ncbi:MAG: sigma-54-dependent Fis family transcriptional regulator [Ignavibacteriales bacterium]|nr:sigma-54-dependent Fis family transcriptional regulator [Ignavibacteriales bacterium]